MIKISYYFSRWGKRGKNGKGEDEYYHETTKFEAERQQNFLHCWD